MSADYVLGVASSIAARAIEALGYPESEDKRKAALRETALRLTVEKRRHAQSYDEWRDASEALDSLLGNDAWKEAEQSDIYDYQLVRNRLEQLRAAREANDTDTLLHLIRTTLSRNLGNMGDQALYTKCFAGTKHLIEEYICECERALQTLMQSEDVDSSKLLSTLIQTRKAFGHTALVLSGGSTFGVLHVGVLLELLKQGLLPRIISGTSAGAIFASIICIHHDDELEDLLVLLNKDFDIFEKRGEEETPLMQIRRFLKYGTFFDNKYLTQTLRTLLGDLTFQEAYYRTRRILSVTVSPSNIHEMPKLLNYLTAPNVLIWSAVAASCSVPFVFPSYDILAKNTRTGEHYSWAPATFIDGSVDNDLPTARLSEMFNVNHVIACQVNPHVTPFLKLTHSIATSYQQNDGPSRIRKVWYCLQDVAANELSHFFFLCAEMGIARNVSSKMRSLLAQKYSGDITILPETKWSEMPLLFKNPTSEFLKSTQMRGAAATWDKLALIRNHCAIELSLDRAIHVLRTNMIPRGPTKDSQHLGAPRHHAYNHHRRKSEEIMRRNLLRKSSMQEVRARKHWSPSPPILSANSSHVNLYALGSVNIARFRDQHLSRDHDRDQGPPTGRSSTEIVINGNGNGNGNGSS